MAAFSRLKNALAGKWAAYGVRIVGVARLGRGDGSGVVRNTSTDQRFRQVWWYRTAADESRVEFGAAQLSESAGLLWENIDAFEGLQVTLGYPPNTNVLHVLGVASDGLTELGGLTPVEQSLRLVATPKSYNFDFLRAKPTLPPSTTLVVEGLVFYDRPDRAARDFFAGESFDFSAAISALGADEHCLAILCLDTISSNLTARFNTASTATLALPYPADFNAADVAGIGVESWMIPLAVVYLYENQATIEETDILRLLDPRAFLNPVTRDNLIATTAPTVTNDLTQGYQKGSFWLNTATNTAYFCADPTTGAAVWLELTTSVAGILSLAKGGTGANLSATGGANQFVKQTSAGAPFTVSAITSGDLTSALLTPPAVGATTPAAGNFTTLTANNAFTALNAGQHTFEGLADGTFNLNMLFTSWGSSSVGTRFVGRHARGTKASPAANQAGDELLLLDGRGHSGSAFTDTAAVLGMYAAENWTTSARGSLIRAVFTLDGTLTQKIGFDLRTLAGAAAVIINGDGTPPTSTLDVVGSVEVGDADAFVLGDPSTNGSWRITRSGSNLVIQRRESGVWVTKQTISA